MNEEIIGFRSWDHRPREMTVAQWVEYEVTTSTENRGELERMQGQIAALTRLLAAVMTRMDKESLYSLMGAEGEWNTPVV